VFDIINKRYNNKKPTIFSSNHSPNELITQRGMMQKTVDRIAEMSKAIIKLSGESYRMKNRQGGLF
jgi:DNA replication protein DnaC